MDRREFLQNSAIASLIATTRGEAVAVVADRMIEVDTFDRPDGQYHGDGWESLNPGYWQIEDHALRRRLQNVGDRARKTGFPYHYETHRQEQMPVEYDPSLPHGSIYRRDWNLKGDFTISIDLTIGDRQPTKRSGDDDRWKMYQPGYGFVGITFGAATQFDSYGISNRASRIVLTDNGRFEFQFNGRHRSLAPDARTVSSPEPGDRYSIVLQVQSSDKQNHATLTAQLLNAAGEQLAQLKVAQVPRSAVDGWFGLTARGLFDVGVDRVVLDPGRNQQLTAPQTECLNCYALGPTLHKVGDDWFVRFVSLFRNDGGTASLRISTEESPTGGWQNVPVAGKAPIVNNDFRVNTAVIEAKLPANPSTVTLYYTVWKDGTDVTADVRIGTDGTGPGTGLVGDVPTSGNYVGRLPQLTAPYRLAGLSCHAINRRVVDPTDQGRPTGQDGSFDVRDQPTYGAYQHLDDFRMQIMVWEDDVWYLELLLYPPSTPDAYKIINTTISGPTSRWQMMRHWNVINPGDHDYGMDDVKGPEQIVIRLTDGLGQDRDYMRRNFQIVHHLITGEEDVDPLANPKKWRQWKMPQRDFSLLIVDSRLWRTSQDTRIWDDEGWGHLPSLYDRADPTRTLLGEEQFAWLQETIRTDSSPLICITGLNGLHTIWTGGKKYSRTSEDFPQRDRVAADYAGWVAAGTDRVLQLLGSRDGIVTVYGDVHNGCILRNRQQRLYECSFGPIGRTGGRDVIKGFGPEMKDYDQRELTVHALYHKQYQSPQLDPIQGPVYWNFLEMHFDPTAIDPAFELRIRNLIDSPKAEPRGGGFVSDSASKTGRMPSSMLPNLQLLANADVHIARETGVSLRGTRTDADGRLRQRLLTDVPVGTRILLTANDGNEAAAQLVVTEAVSS